MELDTTIPAKEQCGRTAIVEPERRNRVLARLRAGWTHEAIARYQALARECQNEDEGIREKLIDKLDRAAANLAMNASADEASRSRPSATRQAKSRQFRPGSAQVFENIAVTEK